MATPPNPAQANPMMQQAQQAMNNPMGAPVNPGGGIDPSVHPIVGQIVRALQAAASGYGWSAMSPQEREQRTALQQQKAEALSRQAIAQQQLGLEAQRTGAEVGLKGQQQKEIEARLPTIGPESAARIAQQQAETSLAQTQAAEAPKLTGIRQQEARTAQQRADQEYETKKEQLRQDAIKTQAEYGPGGLRGREVGAEESRAGTDAKLADIADKRWALEKEKDEADIQRAGLSTDLKAIEDKRSNAKAATMDIYGKSPWYEKRSTTRQTIQNQLDAIDTYYDKQLSDAQKAAGTGAGAKGLSPEDRNRVGGALGRNQPAPTPGSHVFSRQAWSAANPKGDVEGAARSAAAAGYQVTN